MGQRKDRGNRPERIAILAVIALIGVGPPACERPTAQDEVPGATVRDSAGIRIVENHAPTWDTAGVWVIDPEPEFVIGGLTAGQAGAVDTGALVWNIVAAGLLSDGMVVMLSPRGDSKVLVFEPTGSLFASFGRRGEGPGEFSNPQHLQVLPGDTIVVWDRGFGPISYFDPSGTLLRDRRVDVGRLIEVLQPKGQTPGESVHLPLPDGSFVLESMEREWEAPTRGIFRPPRQFLRIDSTYSANEFGWWRGMEQFRIYPPAAAIGYLPFPANSSVAVGGDPLSVYITNGDRYEIHQFSAAGVLRRIIRVTSDPIPITSAELNGWKEGMRAANPNWDWGAWERSFGELAERSFRPGVSRMLVDTQGYLWVFTGMAWNVFSEEGRWLGTLETPGGRTLWVGDDLVILRRTDPDTGVESVEGHRLLDANLRVMPIGPAGFHQLEIPDITWWIAREAVLNALVHRDYFLHQSIHMRLSDDQIEITSPGGFIGGVTAQNILRHPPVRRNPLLADVLQTIGLVNRLGPGVDRIFQESLSLGKDLPRYEADESHVKLVLPTRTHADFARFVQDMRGEGRELDVDDLIVLRGLVRRPVLDRWSASRLLQLSEEEAAATLISLKERGFLIPQGRGRGTKYGLARRYSGLVDRTGVDGDIWLDEESVRLRLLAVLPERGRLTNAEIRRLSGYSRSQVLKLMRSLRDEGLVEVRGRGRGAHYVPVAGHRRPMY